MISENILLNLIVLYYELNLIRFRMKLNFVVNFFRCLKN